MNTYPKLASATKIPAYAFAFALLFGLSAAGGASAKDLNGRAAPDEASQYEHLHSEVSGPAAKGMASIEATNGTGAADDVPLYEHTHSGGHTHNPSDDGDQYRGGD